MLQVLEKEPAPPRALNAAVPRDLEMVCLKCLQKDPQRRYGSALALAEDLERWRAGEPIQARPARAAERVLRWVRRRPTLTALIAVSGLAALALVALLVGTYFNGQLQTAYGQLQTTNAQLQTANDQLEQLNGKLDDAAQDARGQKSLAQRYLYMSDMSLAHRAWEERRGDRTRELLDRHRPSQPDQDDLRGFEWHYLWRLCQDEPPRAFQGHTDPVRSVAVSPDGRRLASAGADRMIKVWDATAPEPDPAVAEPAK